jgi:dipeptide/tripeptide permease
MIFLYSGFWVLYFQMFDSVLWYVKAYVDAAPLDGAVNAVLSSVGLDFRWRFDVEHVTVINAGTIILLQVLVSRTVRNVAPLTAMVSGMIIGSVGFVCLAFASTPWIFILGIAVFSIGEMTAHPKYYSYIGLVAPADKKAVYMGYAFLYGVIGSLIGSTLGGSLYENFLKPLVGTADPSEGIRTFWLGFAVLGGVAAGGLLTYNRFFSADTPEKNRRAEKTMLAIYAVVLLAGIVFGYTTLTADGPVSYRTLVQAAIMLVLGGVGLGVTVRRDRAA